MKKGNLIKSIFLLILIVLPSCAFAQKIDENTMALCIELLGTDTIPNGFRSMGGCAAQFLL